MDAIDNQLEVESAFGSCGSAMAEEPTANRWVRVDGDKMLALMTQSVTDDMLLNWPDGFAAHASPIAAAVPVSNSTSNISSLPASIAPQPPQRRHCGPSTSSDYSTFDFVESSNLAACPEVPGGLPCAGCDRLREESVSPVTCRFASHHSIYIP